VGGDFSHTSRQALGPTQPPVQWVQRSFSGIKRPVRGADHPPLSSAEVTKGYSYTSIHPLGQFRPVTGVLFVYFHVRSNQLLLLIRRLSYWAYDSGFYFRQDQEIFVLIETSRPVLGTTQHSVQWVPRAHSLGVKRPECQRARLPHLVPGMRGTIPLLLYVPTMTSKGTIYLFYHSKLHNLN
jgi:hypothetical protein